MLLINRTLSSFLILSPFALPALCLPHATHPPDAEQRSPATNASLAGPPSDLSVDRTGPIGLAGDQETWTSLPNDRVPSGYHAVPLAASLACVTSVLLILLILKITYLKNRRLRTIHELPAFCTAWSLTEDEESTYEHPLPRLTDTLSGRDVRSLQDRSRHRSSGLSSSTSASSEPFHRKLRDSIPGFLVGMLGSPDWETRMQRELANHQWRLRRESRNLSIHSQRRHTWPSQRSRAGSYVSTVRSHSKSSAVQRHDNRPGRHSSLRIPNVSSFGKLYPDIFREKKGRSKSLNAIIDRMNAGRSGSISACSPVSSGTRQSNSYTLGSMGSSGPSVPTMSLCHRPSTIREVDTPPPTATLPQEATFRFQVTNYGDGKPLEDEGGAPSARAPDSRSTGSGFGLVAMGPSSTYGHMSASRVSSLGGSCRQIPQVPSSPESPGTPALDTPQVSGAIQVNAVHVRPRYLSEEFYNSKLYSSGLFSVSGLGFHGKDRISNTSRKAVTAFSPLTLDLGFPALSDLLCSDLLKSGSAPVNERLEKQDSGAAHIQESPVKSASSELSRFLAPKQQQQLNPLSAMVLNRHHSRVREHVPFSIVTPPPAYLKSPRSLGRPVRFTPGNFMVSDSAVTHTTSLVDLPAPVRPSPLRRVASLGSIGSSSTSLRSSVKLSNISKNSNTSLDAAKNRSSELNRDAMDSSLQVLDADSRILRPKASHASFFLDLGWSSPGVDDDDQSESYSFGVAESSGINQSFNYSQASSSGLVIVTEDCPDEDVDYIVEVHSNSFAGV